MVTILRITFTGAPGTALGRSFKSLLTGSALASADLERVSVRRCIFRHRREKVYVVADGYRGREIKQAVADFFAFAAGHAPEEVPISDLDFVSAAGASDLVAYVGHDGLMDFGLNLTNIRRTTSTGMR